MTAQPSESVTPTSSQSTYEIYRACHSFNHDVYGEIRHDSRLTVDSVYNSFLDATHDIVPHWRNLLGTDLDWVETSRWNYSIDNGSGWLFGVQGVLWIYIGPWESTEPVYVTCTITTDDI